MKLQLHNYSRPSKKHFRGKAAVTYFVALKVYDNSSFWHFASKKTNCFEFELCLSFLKIKRLKFC